MRPSCSAGYGMKRLCLMVAVLPALLAAGSAFAGVDRIRASNNQFAIEQVSTDVDYSETGNRTLGTQTGLLDTEKGSVPGYAFELSAMGDVLFENAYLDLRYSHVDGYTRYVGALATGGPYGSVVGSNVATLSDYRLRLGEGFAVGDNFLLTPYAEIGHHRWFRGVNDGETYTHHYWGVGLLAQAEIAPGLVLSEHAMVGQTFSPHIDVAGPGGFSDSLGTANLYAVGIASDYALSMAVHMHVDFSWTGFKYGMGSIHAVPGGYAWEPDSTTRYATLSAGIGYAF